MTPSLIRPRSPLGFMGKQVAKLGLISNKRTSFLRSGEADGDSGLTCSASSTIIVQAKPRVSFLFDDSSVPQRSDAKSSYEDLPLISILCCQLLAGCTPPKFCYGQLSCSMPRRLRFRLWQPQCETVFVAHQAPKLTTLYDLLTRKRRCGIPLRQRLQLSLKLASSVLQLYSSGWLPASWSSKDIVFFEDGNGVKIEHPMVRNAESRPGKARQTKPQTPRRADESLLSLGIVLIELYYGWTLAKCVEENIEPDSQGVLATFTNNPLDEQIRHDWADALVDNLYDDAGDDYGEAVRRCIRGLDHRESSLTKDAVKVKMYQDVIGPLKIVEGFYAEKIS